MEARGRTKATSMPPAGPSSPLPGQEHIKRYWDPTRDCYAAKILPGEFYVTTAPELITTVLGSCVSACIRDCKLGIGGMNHFMLPDSVDHNNWGGESLAARYGSYAMEAMINAIIKAGGERSRFEIKAFGGGNVVAAATSVGDNNVNFLYQYLEIENLKLAASDLGGSFPRKVVFFPRTGKVHVKKLYDQRNATIRQREEQYSYRLEHKPISGDVELFD